MSFNSRYEIAAWSLRNRWSGLGTLIPRYMGGILRVCCIRPIVRVSTHTLSIGAVDSHAFVCGGNEDGCIRLWDMRKLSDMPQTVMLSSMTTLIRSADV